MMIEKKIEQSFLLSFETTQGLFDYLKSNKSNASFNWTYFSKNLKGEEELVNELLETFEEYLDFYSLSSNNNFKWTEKIINNFSDKINWYSLSVNPNLQLTNDILERFQDKWHWGHNYGSRKYGYYNKNSLSSNPSFPKDPFIIEKFKEKIDWRALGLNTSLSVYTPIWEYSDADEIEMVERNIFILKTFKEHWRYKRSTFIDDNACISGLEKTSIFDNKSINWKSSELRKFFDKEIEEFNNEYNESI
jgi:hypothetical protein